MAIVSRVVAIVVGLALAGGAIFAVFFVDWSRPLPERPAVVRPVRTVVVGARPEVERSLPARVRATTEVTLSFQVPGVVQELPAVRGASFVAGEVLAQLDQRDFRSRLTATSVQLAQLRTEFEAITRAYEAGAATTIEVARHRAAVERTEAELEVAEKALEDTTLLAPFDGVVADVFVDRFQKVGVGTAVLRMQGRAAVRVQVNVDTTRVAMARQLETASRHVVRFDFLPGREFEASLVEFTSEADPRTQTFLAIFEIEPPDGILLLPGMPATLVERRPPEDPDLVSVPLDAVQIDGSGGSWVWFVEESGEGLATVRRGRVELGPVLDDAVIVAEGLRAGQRIAAAGLGELEDGQRVRPQGGEPGAPAR